MSILQKMFGAAPVQQVQNGPGNIPNTQQVAGATVTNPATAPNGTLPATTVAAAEAQSPLAEFKDLFKVDPNAPAPTGTQQIFNVDQAKIIEAAKGKDFKQAITPEITAAIAAGGEGAVQAMMELMNGVAQSVYAQSVFAGTQLIERGVAGQFARSSEVPDLIRKHSTNAALAEANPLYTNPAVAPLFEMAKNQMLVKYPNATPSELTALTNNYMNQFAEAVKGPQTAAEAATKAPKETDWSTFG